jgi:hypothetical protein
MFVPSESTIILAIVGMVGLFSTALIYQRANRNASVYYTQDKRRLSQTKGQEKAT